MSDETTTEVGQDNTETAEVEDKSFLPDDYAGNEHLSDFKEPGDLAKAYLDKITAFGKLEEGFKPPESPDDYKLEIENEEDSKAFRTLAHEAGITQKQAKVLADRLIEANKANDEAQDAILKEARESAEASLKKDWGDDYEANVEGAKKVVRTIGDENLANWLDETHMGDIIPLIRFCHKVSTLISEDSLEEGGHKPEPLKTEDGRPMLRYGTMEG